MTDRYRRSNADTGDRSGPAESGRSHHPGTQGEGRPEVVQRLREARQRAVERQRRRLLATRIGLAALGLLVAVGLGSAIFGGPRNDEENPENVVPEGTEEFAYVGSDHIGSDEPQTVAYAETPPVGGKHDPAWQNCGYYDAPIRSESAVHSLEHGAVWITYRPDLPQDQIDLLRELASEQTYVLASPFAELPTPVVASSWGRRVLLDGADDKRLGQFLRRFKEGPETPERGAACAGGVGTPL